MKLSFALTILSLFLISSMVSAQTNYENLTRYYNELKTNKYFNDQCFKDYFTKYCAKKPWEYIRSNMLCESNVMHSQKCVLEKCLYTQNITPDICFSEHCPLDFLGRPYHVDAKNVFAYFLANCKKP